MNTTTRKICTCCLRCEEHCNCDQECFYLWDASFKESEPSCCICEEDEIQMLKEDECTRVWNSKRNY